MKLSAGTLLLFLISFALVATGVLAHLRLADLPPEVVANRFWLVLGGWGLLSAGLLVRNA
ncbi:MAG TPA: hypothetical protein VD929_04870 [Caulobacteraceae bacterium]|nr:hypothetical protein [Caulobacteraceae bacterium]